MTTRPRPLADTSPASLVAGFVALLVGYTSSVVLMFQAGQNAGLSTGQISSWIGALSLGVAVTTIGLSLRYRMPIVTAWSTPGAALLITSLPSVPYSDAIGAYVTCALLLTVTGLSGTADRLMRRVPPALAGALLAGILFHIAVDICRAAEHRTLLVLGMALAYLLARRLLPRYCVLVALATGLALATGQGLIDGAALRLEWSTPVWTTPSFSLAATIGIALPLFVVAMASQNMPGMAVLRTDGYTVPASPLVAVTGIASLLLAPFGAHGMNLSAIGAAICTGPQAHEDPAKRYTAALWCGLFYGLVACFGGTLAALLGALPRELVISVAALALLGAIVNGLQAALAEPRHREAALITFLVTASGVTLGSVGAAFWGLVAGLVACLILAPRRA